MSLGFIGKRVGTAVTMGTDGGVFSKEDNFYLNTLGPSLNVPFSATGGTKSTSDRPGWITHRFTGDGTFTVSQGGAAVEYLVLAGGGGGGGGSHQAGGGGAGGLRVGAATGSSGGGASAESTITLTTGAYAITVGSGGAAGPNPMPTKNGSNSSIAALVVSTFAICKAV